MINDLQNRECLIYREYVADSPKFELTSEDRKRIIERNIEAYERGKRLDKLRAELKQEDKVRAVAKSMGVCIVQKTDKPTTLFL